MEEWTAEKNAKVLRILKDVGGSEKTHRYYHVMRTYEQAVFGDVERVRRRWDDIMLQVDFIPGIVRNVQLLAGTKVKLKLTRSFKSSMLIL